MEPGSRLRFRSATPESTFSQIFSKRGLSIDLGGSWLLPKLVGLQQAKRLALLAETIDAAEAFALKLVTGWCPPRRSTPSSTTWAVDWQPARRSRSPDKALLNEGVDRTMRDALANEARAQIGNFATTDAAAAYAAFAERREPSFTGRWALSKSDEERSE